MTHETETVEIDGHKVPAHLADLFYNAHDGSRVSDEDWDIQRERMRKHHAWPFDERGA